MLSPGAAIIWVLRPDIQVARSHGWWLQAQLVLPLRVLQLSKLGLLHAPWVLTAWKLGSKKKFPKHVEAEAEADPTLNNTQHHYYHIPLGKEIHKAGPDSRRREIDSTSWQRNNRNLQLTYFFFNLNAFDLDFPGGIVVKNLPANTGDMSLIPGLGRFHMLQSNYPPVPQLLKPTHPRARAPSLRVAPTHCSQRKPTQSNKDPVQQKLVNK